MVDLNSQITIAKFKKKTMLEAQSGDILLRRITGYRSR